MIFHCFFEQSGTFKNEFIKLGYAAYDYDIEDSFGETDFQVDLFEQIDRAYDHENSLFDFICSGDFIFAFYPCTRFECVIPLAFRGELIQLQKYDDVRKLEYSMKLHNELNSLYIHLCKLVIIAYRRNFKMIIENPYTQPHYLTSYWCLKPSFVDLDRRKRGDYFKKPTQYYFINFEPKNNFIMEPLIIRKKLVVDRVCDDDQHTRKEKRSLISPEYANRFIREFILEAA